MLVSAALRAPVAVLKLRETRMFCGSCSVGGYLQAEDVDVGRIGGMKGSIHVTSLLKKKKINLKWSKP